MSCYDNKGNRKKNCVEEPQNSFYTKQQIDNLFEQFILLQNNFVRVLNLEQSDLSGIGTLKEQIVDYINNLETPLIIGETDSKLNIHIIDYEETYELINLGKGQYGDGKLQIATANLFKIASSATNLVWVEIDEDITAIPNTGYITDSVTKIVVTLPSDNSTYTVRFFGNWKVNIPAGKTLLFTDEIITESIESTGLHDAVEILHTNNTFKIISSVGNIQFNNL